MQPPVGFGLQSYEENGNVQSKRMKSIGFCQECLFIIPNVRAGTEAGSYGNTPHSIRQPNPISQVWEKTNQ